MEARRLDPASLLYVRRAQVPSSLRGEARSNRLHARVSGQRRGAAFPAGVPTAGGPRTARERLWLYVQLVCRLQALAAARGPHGPGGARAAILRIENRRLKTDLTTLEREYKEILRELKMERGEEMLKRPICNVVWASPQFRMRTASPEWTMFAYGECNYDSAMEPNVTLVDLVEQLRANAFTDL